MNDGRVHVHPPVFTQQLRVPVAELVKIVLLK